jgi:hypothetical protein
LSHSAKPKLEMDIVKLLICAYKLLFFYKCAKNICSKNLLGHREV